MFLSELASPTFLDALTCLEMGNGRLTKFSPERAE